ncbi:MAG: BrnT family toxin [Schwartzia sp.]|nr:BrnT family toxin [Schwartzia sp. (in: firmicutes)]
MPDEAKRIGGMLFEWDSDKNRSNINKHGISFEYAARVFFDMNRIERKDLKHSQVETRYISIGYVDDMLFVVHTDRKDAIRIISARFAEKNERSYYYGQFS